MKICTITCHDVYNHGASLQAYALEHYLEGLGHDVRIIDYKPDYLSRHFDLMAISNPRFDRPMVRWAYRLAKLPGRLAILPRKKCFDEWKAKWLKLTDRRYHSNHELEADCPEADVFIAGSDQIWNTRFPNGRDEAFYLTFALAKARKLSYAASFAYPSIQLEYVEFVKKQLQGLDAISVREETGVALLKTLGLDGVQVVDPVFLLSAIEWNPLCAPDLPRERHVVVYDFEDSPQMRTVVERIAKATGSKIWSVGQLRLSYADRNFSNAGPDVFIGAIHDAECVISNSFHATAFSLIFHKDLFVVRRQDGLNDRMESLLNHYGISDRLVSADATTDTLLAHVDYDRVVPVMEQDAQQSKEWLKNNLACE